MSTRACVVCGKPTKSRRHKYCHDPCNPKTAYNARNRKYRRTLEDKIADLQNERDHLSSKVDYLETLTEKLLQRLDQIAITPQHPTTTPRAPTRPPTTADLDIKLEVKKASGGTNASHNFMRQAMALQEIEWTPPTPTARKKGPRAMDVPTFNDPSFDDLTL